MDNSEKIISISLPMDCALYSKNHVTIRNSVSLFTTFDELKDSIEGAKDILIRLDFTEKEIESNKQKQIDDFIDSCRDVNELKKLETYLDN